MRDRATGKRRLDCRRCVEDRRKEWAKQRATPERQEARRQYQRKWCEENPEKRSTYSKRAHAKPENKTKRKAWIAQNPEKSRQYTKTYYDRVRRRPARVSVVETNKSAIITDYMACMLNMKTIAIRYNISVSTLSKAIGRWGIARRAYVVQGKEERLRRAKETLPKCYHIWAYCLGKEEADKRLTERRAGTGRHWREGLTTEQIQEAKHGKEYAVRKQNTYREECSKRCAGSGNPMYGKPAPLTHGSWGGTGWYKGIFFRSLRELTYLMVCGCEGRACVSAEYMSIPYALGDTPRTYHPDFLVDGAKLVEIKPLRGMRSESVVAKRDAAIRFCEAHGLTYHMVDIVPDIEAIYAGYVAGEICFTKHFEDVFWYELLKRGQRSVC